ncbi:MAG: GDYXXLXY domain-containing protein [Paludibacteraceae bacterium]|nr:GDYXXLXY domain-containing protein [Paludibacteraceae bacterium]MBR6042893.1 GDYXXLXY domain-containing protein [Paludibacteraceae bacterium]
MSKTKLYIITANLLAVLAFFTYSVVNSEKIRSDGQIVLLELVPTDPRSLMQGDYMRLRYRITLQIISHSIDTATDSSLYYNPSVYKNLPETFYSVLRVGRDSIGSFVRNQTDAEGLNENEIVLHCKKGKENSIRFGGEDYFFEEGSSHIFDEAAYGMLKVDRKGNCVLIGLCDSKKELIDLTKTERDNQ